jgi:hypothetical protein
MNLAQLERKLYEVARAQPPNDRVPYAYEKRVMACLKGVRVADVWDVWSHALWRAAGPCLGIMVVLSAWSWFAPVGNTQTSDLSQDFENTVFAAADQEIGVESIW